MTKFSYTPTIGLEIHAELKTKTKMFCGCFNDPDEHKPNVNICPVCMAHPGTLPIVNKEAVRKVLLVGSALQGLAADFTEFDRKNYFYPDIPKGYQISQYKYPLITGGYLMNVPITRIHLEEDTARSQHERNISLIDFNRAGLPLMELVTEPTIHDAGDAGTFARELQLLLRYLDVSHANLEKGEMRVEANISVSNNDILGTKVEVKNLNSFRSVERAISYEINRQIEVIEKGGDVIQETRGWNEGKQETFSQRKKESSHDYRYFPEPDIPKLKISEIKEFALESLSLDIGELPNIRRKKYQDLGIKSDDADMFTKEIILGNFFDKVLSKSKKISHLAANYITSDIAGKLERGEVEEDWLKDPIQTDRFVKLMEMVFEERLSSRGAKDVLQLMFNENGEPEDIAKNKGLLQQSDTESLKVVISTTMSKFPEVVEQYRLGKKSSIQFLLGMAIKESRGAGNPTVLKNMLEDALSALN